jgi:hypothetical protein
MKKSNMYISMVDIRILKNTEAGKIESLQDTSLFVTR